MTRFARVASAVQAKERAVRQPPQQVQSYNASQQQRPAMRSKQAYDAGAGQHSEALSNDPAEWGAPPHAQMHIWREAHRDCPESSQYYDAYNQAQALQLAEQRVNIADMQRIPARQRNAQPAQPWPQHRYACVPAPVPQRDAQLLAHPQAPSAEQTVQWVRLSGAPPGPPSPGTPPTPGPTPGDRPGTPTPSPGPGEPQSPEPGSLPNPTPPTPGIPGPGEPQAPDPPRPPTPTPNPPGPTPGPAGAASQKVDVSAESLAAARVDAAEQDAAEQQALRAADASAAHMAAIMHAAAAELQGADADIALAPEAVPLQAGDGRISNFSEIRGTYEPENPEELPQPGASGIPSSDVASAVHVWTAIMRPWCASEHCNRVVDAVLAAASAMDNEVCNFDWKLASTNGNTGFKVQVLLHFCMCVQITSRRGAQLPPAQAQTPPQHPVPCHPPTPTPIPTRVRHQIQTQFPRLRRPPCPSRCRRRRLCRCVCVCVCA